MKALNTVDGPFDQKGTQSMSPTSMAVERGSLPREDEIMRLREENARLRKGLQEIRQLLDQPAAPRPARLPKMFPKVGLL